MKIAFYSPLKSPRHPVPSGDRLMARLMIQVLRHLGHEVVLQSELRTFMASPDDVDLFDANLKSAQAEIDRIARAWDTTGVPDLWFTYHPYYKAPDLIGPSLSRRVGIPLVNAEASYSRRRNIGAWKQSQDLLLQSIDAAAFNLCLTRRDHEGLRSASSTAALELIQPFIDASAYLQCAPAPEPGRLITVAMMRPGDKLSSYRGLAESLRLIADLPWTLSIAGDGACRSEVEDAFAGFAPGRIEWLGALEEPAVASLLARGALLVWPGHGEAYGLAYLEAQAAGLPVVAEATAGVPEVVENGRTGLLTPPGDRSAFAEAIACLLKDNGRRQAMAQQARIFATRERSVAGAAQLLGNILRRHLD